MLSFSCLERSFATDSVRQFPQSEPFPFCAAGEWLWLGIAHVWTDQVGQGKQEVSFGIGHVAAPSFRFPAECLPERSEKQSASRFAA